MQYKVKILASLAACFTFAVPALGSVGYGIEPTGGIFSFDSSNPSLTDPIVGAPVGSADGLARDPSTGALWAIGWSGNLFRIDPAAGTWTAHGLVPRPNGSGFYKDLAWDPVHNRLLATHLGSAIGMPGTANRVVQINTLNSQYTEIGVVTGIPGTSGQLLGLAIDAQGRASVYDASTAFIYDLGPVPATPVGTLPATPRAVRSFIPGTDMRGLEFDQATGQLFASGQGLFLIAPGGASTLIPGFSSPPFRDITFIPAPGSCCLLALAAVLSPRRRRR